MGGSVGTPVGPERDHGRRCGDRSAGRGRRCADQGGPAPREAPARAVVLRVAGALAGYLISDAGGPRRATGAPYSPPAPGPLAVNARAWSGNGMRWSPDGRTLAFVTPGGRSVWRGDKRIELCAIGGSTRRSVPKPAGTVALRAELVTGRDARLRHRLGPAPVRQRRPGRPVTGLDRRSAPAERGSSSRERPSRSRSHPTAAT